MHQPHLRLEQVQLTSAPKMINRKIFLIIIVSVLAIAGIFVVNNKTVPKYEPSPSTTTQAVQKTFNAEITIDYAGQVNKPVTIIPVTVGEGETAWDAVRGVVGQDNIAYKDYGGDLGIFISSINNVIPQGNKFWLFKVNGEGSKVGVSSYKLKDGDKIEFVIAEAVQGQ